MLGTTIGASVFLAVPLALFGVYFLYAARREENFMVAQFPEQYPAYQAANAHAAALRAVSNSGRPSLRRPRRGGIAEIFLLADLPDIDTKENLSRARHHQGETGWKSSTWCFPSSR
jgi:hypothetical protein